MVILNEVGVYASFLEFFLLITFQEEASFILENSGLDQQNITRMEVGVIFKTSVLCFTGNLDRGSQFPRESPVALI